MLSLHMPLICNITLSFRQVRIIIKHEQPQVLSRIGVGVGNFLGMQRIFAEISPYLPEKFFCDFCL